MFFDIKEKLPNPGEVVRVVGVVRYGRKKQIMAAKRILFSDYPCDPESIIWIALKSGSQYTKTIRLKEVFSWEYL